MDTNVTIKKITSGGYIENISEIEENEECLVGNNNSEREQKLIGVEDTVDQKETTIQRKNYNPIENIIDIENNEESIVEENIYDDCTCSKKCVYDIFDN